MTTDTETETPAPSPRRRSLGIRFALAFLLGLILVAGVGGGALYAYGQQYTGRILPGVRVGDVDLSGQSAAGARSTLESAYASLGAGRVLVSGPDGELTIGYAEIGRGPDVDAMLGAALDAGRQGEPVADLIGVPQAALRGIRIAPEVTYDAARLAAAVAAVARTVDVQPVDAALTTASDGTFALSSSQDGRVVDQAALLADIEAQIARVDAPAEIRVDLPIVIRSPALTTPDAIVARATADRMTADLVLSRGEDRWTIPSAELRKLVSFSVTADGGLVPVLDVSGIDPLLAAVAKDVDQAPQSATFKLSGSKVLLDAKSKEGRSMDLEATRSLVVDALMARQAGQTEPVVQPVVSVTEPAMTTAQAEQVAPQMQELGRWKTYFPIYVNNGFGANIWIPAKLINGYVVGAGDKFDFWDAVGTVTREKGYKDGGAIINGKTEPQGALAGGICSCSTTLFNAALRAGMKMEARRNHYYYISRYPLGLDATVFISASGSKQTMSFTNDTAYPVLIRGINTRSGSRGYVTFVLYGVPTGRTVSIAPAIVKNVHKATDTIQYTSSLPKGSSKRVEYPVDGKDVWRTVTVKENGVVIRETTYYSHYSTITGIVQVGTRGGGTPSPTPKPSPSPTPDPTPSPAP
jgi:vancomycin resistance protein YoaR